MLALFCGLKARAVRLIFSNAWFSYAAKLPEPSLPPRMLFPTNEKIHHSEQQRLGIACNTATPGCIGVILRAASSPFTGRSSEASRARERAERAAKVLAPVSFGLPLTFDLRGYRLFIK